MEPGDVIGWYDSGSGAIGYSEEDAARQPVCLGSELDEPVIGQEDVVLAELANRAYGIRICYGKESRL